MTKIVTVTGRNGFIGGAIKKRLLLEGVEVVPSLQKEADLVFLFGSPSSNILYNKDLYGCINETVSNFLHALEFCKQHGIKLVYPSSATVYQKANNYAHTKAALEELQAAYDTDVLGWRIAAGYGVGEEHKGDYASVVYQWCKLMKNGESPVIYGDGTQTRDFVYIDDIAETITGNTHLRGQADIRTGVETSFNRVIEIINSELGTDIKPIYVPAPQKYVTSTVGGKPLTKFVSIEEGIKKIIQNL